MSVENGGSHTAYSPVLLLMAALAVSLCLGIVVARSTFRQKLGAGGLLLLIGLSPLPLMLLSYAHLPMLSSLGAGRGFCFGEIGLLHIVSFLLPQSVGLLTLLALRTKAAEEHR